MEKIKELIKNNQLKEAADSLAGRKNDSDYPEMLYLIGKAYLDKYEQTKPSNHNLYEEARQAFAAANTAYKILFGKANEKYLRALKNVERTYQSLNMRPKV